MASFYKLAIFIQNSNICKIPQTKAMNRHSLFRPRRKSENGQKATDAKSF